MKLLKLISIKKHPEWKQQAIQYIQSKWAHEQSLMVYDNCISHCLTSVNPLPQWYLLVDQEKIVGCAGLITNDFISRMDLYPWICALYIEEAYRGNDYGNLLLAQAQVDAKKGGFDHVYLCTDHIGLYERYGFEYHGIGYHPWGDRSRIYKKVIGNPV